jgi:eukaryotic-like serine/threonine-protein kinase
MYAGEIIDDRFEIGRTLGAGGMGQVYLARDLLGGEPVAVKVLLGAGMRDLHRFSREAEVLASLQIQGVVRYIAHGSTNAGQPYLVMEWLAGETLESRLARGPLGLVESVTLARRVAETLAAVHRCGVIHRDIKPGNLLLVGGEVERVTLLDFGIARAAGLDFPRLTLTGALVGTLAYMAPEQARGLPSIDARVDLFALGCVLHECIAGCPPFFASDVLSLLMKVILEKPPRLRQVRADVPAWLDALVAHLLAKAPEERPKDAGAVAAALAAPEGITLDRGARDLGAWAPIAAARAEVTLTQDPGVYGEVALGSVPLDRELPALSRNTASAAPSRRAGGNITASERKVQCLIVAEMERPLTEAAATGVGDLQRERALRGVVARHGAAIDVLQGRWLLVVLSGAAAPTDLAARAAHCALALRGLVVGMPIAVATGRAEIESPAHAGELIARAVHLLDDDLTQAGGAAIHIDDVTVPFLEQRFDGAHEPGCRTGRARGLFRGRVAAARRARRSRADGAG